MLDLLVSLAVALASMLRSRQSQALEILALRQQLAIYKRTSRRPRLRGHERVFWVLLSRVWRGWRSALIVVKPATVIAWHRMGFKLYWTWKSRGGRGPGRPPVSKEVRDLVRRMVAENPAWGAPRIHGELLKLGFDVSERTVSRLVARAPKPPSQTWRTFLANHTSALASVDFFVVYTITFELLYVFVILEHERRRVVHFGVTSHPSAEWTANHVVQAFPFDTAPRFMIRDRDKIYGAFFRRRARQLEIQQAVTARKSPWQNPYVERMIGSIRRECLDHSIILDERHLRRLLRSYFRYYHGSRTHLALCKDAPTPRPVQTPELGEVVAIPQVGGLHHRYERRAA